ncbi:MAG: hypothetical protein GX897_01930 [Clostridiales bacterium]|jgi:hypothetical protein|nr:hypothetical protein [Clostridiales bacterium]
MSWAKYNEDNFEIIRVREYLRETETRPQRKTSGVGKSRAGVMPAAPAVKYVKPGGLARVQEKYEDRYLECLDCGRLFCCSAEAQKRYAENKSRYPRRCESCR